MSEVKSALGVKKISNSNFKQFEVPDESEYSEQQMQTPKEFTKELAEIKRQEENAEQRRRAVSGKDRLSQGAVDRIGLLLGMTRTLRSVVISDDLSFELKSLKTLELRDVVMLTNKVSNVEVAFEMRRQYLARTINKISGHDFEYFISSNKIEDKLMFVDELDDAVASRLYDEFLLLKDEAQSKYQIKTNEEMKEAMSDLKKIVNEPEHRFIWYLCKQYKVLPDDPLIVEMDPVLKIWMYNNWVEDQKDNLELLKDHAYLSGSFHNPEAVRKLLDTNKVEISDEDFDQITDDLKAGKFDNIKIVEPDKKNRNRKIKREDIKK